jgi:phytanoyl-CoA hydroxylase
MPVLEETLTGEQITQFARDGYVILRGLFRPAEIAQIRETFMSENAQGPVPGLSDGFR